MRKYYITDFKIDFNAPLADYVIKSRYDLTSFYNFETIAMRIILPDELQVIKYRCDSYAYPSGELANLPLKEFNPLLMIRREYNWQIVDYITFGHFVYLEENEQWYIKNYDAISLNTQQVRDIINNNKIIVTIPLFNPKTCFRYNEKGEPNEILDWRYGNLNHRIYPIEEYFTYNIGDVLYVKEEWYQDSERVIYKAHYGDKEKFYKNGEPFKIKWKSAASMNRDQARLKVRVINRRIEEMGNGFKNNNLQEVIELELIK